MDPMKLSRGRFSEPGAFIGKAGLMLDWLDQIE